jgi:hypothetical protein
LNTIKSLNKKFKVNIIVDKNDFDEYIYLFFIKTLKSNGESLQTKFFLPKNGLDLEYLKIDIE